MLYDRRLQDIVVTYKVKYGVVPDNVSNLFVRKDSAHSLRNNDFVIPRFSTIRHGKHSIRYIDPFLWSKLNKDLREASSLASFRNKIRELTFSEYISNNCVRGTRTQPLICVGCSVHYWVSCGINKGGFFEIVFSSLTHICLALRRLLTFCLF